MLVFRKDQLSIGVTIHLAAISEGLLLWQVTRWVTVASYLVPSSEVPTAEVHAVILKQAMLAFSGFIHHSTYENYSASQSLMAKLAITAVPATDLTFKK